jgi:integrase
MSLKEKSQELLDDQDVSRWINNLNSESCKRLYLEALAKYCMYRSLTPEQVVEEFKNPNEAQDRLTDFIIDARKKYAPKVTNNILVGIKSWLRHNDILVTRKISSGNTRETPTIQDEYPPDNRMLRKILDHVSIRSKIAICLTAYTGLRFSSVIGLTLSNLPELKIEGEKVAFEKIPVQIKVPIHLSKNKKPYITFLIEEGCQYLTQYLEDRLRKKEELGPNSRVIVTNDGKPMDRRVLGMIIKREFQKTGFPFRPYVLRSYFDTAIINARTIPHDIQQFVMGHSGSIEAVYTVNKRLPEWQVDEMRATFKQIEPKLTTIPTSGTPSEIDITLKTLETMFKARPGSNVDEFYKAKSIIEAAARTEKLGRPTVAQRRGKASLGELSKEEKVELLLAELQKPAAVNNGNNHECQFCSAPVELDDMFCGKCLKQIRVKCRRCERLTRVGQPICVKCGAKLK